MVCYSPTAPPRRRGSSCSTWLLIGLLVVHAALPPPARALIGYPSGLYLNQQVGATAFYDLGLAGGRAIVANIEAGAIWNGHETLVGRVSQFIADPTIVAAGNTQLGQFDWHATEVGQAIGGLGQYTSEVGIAPWSDLWSGSIAVIWTGTSERTGSFLPTDASFAYPYVTAMRTGIQSGGVTRRAHVVNSSWGYDDSTAQDPWTITIDALARENNVVTVAAAGNGGPASDTVGGPATGYNTIAVAALVGDATSPPYSQVASFSSRGPADFYNPVTSTTTPAARAVVDIAAPGTNMFLAAYTGTTGGNKSGVDLAPGATNLFWVNDAGTSFSAPIVAGGGALMVDAGRVFVDVGAASAEMLDARVIKATMMAGAAAPNGWNNGQQSSGGVITTTQALDYATGAGMLDLAKAARIYVGDPNFYVQGNLVYTSGPLGANTTLGVSGSSGGTGLDWMGWDLGEVINASGTTAGGSNAYAFAGAMPYHGTLTAALTWFADRELNAEATSATDIALSNLSLQLYRTDVTGDPWLVAQSIAPYGTSEFLRVKLPYDGSYELRVLGLDQNYNVLGTPVTTTSYGLAWAVAVPEPSTWALLLAGGGLAAWAARRRRRSLTTAPRPPSLPDRPSAAAPPAPPGWRNASRWHPPPGHWPRPDTSRGRPATDSGRCR